MSIIKRPRRSALVALVGIVVLAAVLAGWMVHVAQTQVIRAGPSNDYPWGNAIDCSQDPRFGIYSWCLKGGDLSPLGFGYRNCTDYAAYELNAQMGGSLSNLKFAWADINVKSPSYQSGDGNARAWKQGAINKYGAGSVNGTPAVGAVAWWGSEVGHGYGHVGIVAYVSPDLKSIIVYSYNAKGDGNFLSDPISTTKPGWNKWPDAFLHIADSPTSSGNSGYGSPSDYAGKIVQWKDDPKAQKTAWLVSPDLKRYWIPDSSTFYCLESSGFSFAKALPSTLLDRLPDQTGHWAKCGGDTLGTNQYLFRGGSLVSSNGKYHLELQRSDGKLVLKGPTGTALVSNGVSSDYLVMQPDGNLVTFSYKGGATWATNTVNKGANHLAVGNDGNVALDTSAGLQVWSTFFGILNVGAKSTPTPVPGSHPTATPQHGGPTATPTPRPTATPTPVPQPKTWTEQEGDYGANSFSNPHNASGMGPHLGAMAYVQVSCKLYDPYIASVNPDGYWYRIASAPWNNSYYVAANTFWNGDIPGHTPYTHNTDWNVPNC